ncbi:MAG: serine/threonine protein kinase [Planctomycetaceae bacterium]|nr:serine/threonine protein kinase [Planctomycetaceae bacterium]
MTSRNTALPLTGDERTEELFHAALAQTSDVTAFLKQQCGDDRQLFASVYSLLQAAGGHNRILDQPLSLGSSIRRQIDRSDRPELQLTSGDVLHNYQLMNRLGKGGMGTVFLAQELSPIQREVAIKFTNHQVDDDSTKHRIANERQTLAALNHPRIPTIFNAGVTPDGHTYLVLEYIAGTPIVRYCRQHSTSLSQRLDLFARLCDTVAHVHQQGIIHRDLKSANVLVNTQGATAEPFLVDFGIAKHMTADQPLTLTAELASTGTQHGDLLGTPGCMAPEQYLPGLPAADHRADIYSLGLLLYRLLADQSPFPTSSINRDDQLATLRTPASPTTRNTSSLTWPARLDDVALRCIQLQPEDRYATVSDLKHDIECIRSSIATGQPQRRTMTSRVTPAVTSPRANDTSQVNPASRTTRLSLAGSVRRSSLTLILSAFIVGLFSPALNSLQSVTQTPGAGSTTSSVAPASMVVSLPPSSADPQAPLQTVQVDGKTFGQIAAILDEQGLLPSIPARLVVTAEDDDVGLTIAHHQQSENLPVTANTRSSATPGEKQSG